MYIFKCPIMYAKRLSDPIHRHAHKETMRTNKHRHAHKDTYPVAVDTRLKLHAWHTPTGLRSYGCAENRAASRTDHSRRCQMPAPTAHAAAAPSLRRHHGALSPCCHTCVGLCVCVCVSVLGSCLFVCKPLCVTNVCVCV